MKTKSSLSSPDPHPIVFSGVKFKRILGISIKGSGDTFVSAPILLQHAGESTFSVTATDSLGNATTINTSVTLDTTAPVITNLQPASGSVLNTLSATVSGQVSDDQHVGSVLVNGTAASLSGGQFSAMVNFFSEGENTVFLQASDAAGNVSAADVSYNVITGLHPPVVDALPAAAKINAIMITGHADAGVQVRITGGASEQLFAVMADGSFSAQYSRAPNQTNTLQITAVSSTQESIPATIVIAHDDIPPAQPKLLNYTPVVSSNSIGLLGITDPDIDVLLNGLGTQRTAKSSPGNGMFGFQFDIPANSTKSLTLVASDAAGNVSQPLTVEIRHDPTLKQELHLSVSEPQNWVAPAGQMFPAPLEVILTDSNGDPIQGQSITFEVMLGGGLVNGETSVQKTTFPSGRTSVSFQLGASVGEGINIVRATFDGNIEQPPTFVITGLEPRPGQRTLVEGTVLDENFRAIPGATVTLMRDGFADAITTTDIRGDFTFEDVAPGRYHLRADGTTTTLPMQRYPVLVYVIDVYEGQVNTVGMPIFLPRTQVENKLMVDGVSNQTYTTPSIPKLKLDIAPGSIMYPDGSHSGEFIVSPVPIDVLPMPLPNDWSTSLAISIQPAGTVFNPPLPITFPNLDGLPPGSKAAIVSFDHGAGRYVKVADATVSTDGSVITSDPGNGIHFGAWHAAVPPIPCPTTNIKFGLSADDGSSGVCTAETEGRTTNSSFPIMDPTIIKVSGCTNKTVTAKCRKTIETDDVTVIAWVDGNAVKLEELEPLASPKLVENLNSAFCAAQLGDWLLAHRTFVESEADRQYANAFLLRNSPNAKKPSVIDPDAVAASGDYRIFNRFQAVIDTSNGLIISADYLHHNALIGKTPDPCHVVSPKNPEEHTANGTKEISKSKSTVFQLAEGRLGKEGQAVDRTLNDCDQSECTNPYGKTTPWIWATIKFDANGKVLPLDHQIFPSYSIYINGKLHQDIPQSEPEPFIALDENSQRLPEDIRQGAA